MEKNYASLFAQDIDDILYGYRLYNQDNNDNVYKIQDVSGNVVTTITYHPLDIVFQKGYSDGSKNAPIVIDRQIIQYLSWKDVEYNK